MQGDNRAIPPIVAFFGAKGGVGKTTISSAFARFASQGTDRANILLVDFDVDQPGLTVSMTRRTGFTCSTVHDYMKDVSLQFDGAVDVTGKSDSDAGQIYLIPSATGDAKGVFDVIRDVTYGGVVNRIIDLIVKAVERYNISCVIIDCGPVINPYTAAAAHIAEKAFIIGQNDPISFQSIGNYPGRIREFYPEFRVQKMGTILNKTRAKDIRTDIDIFTVIPFTIEVVDTSEGLTDINTVRMSLFEQYIKQLVTDIFVSAHPGLVPAYGSALSDDLKSLAHDTARIRRQRKFRRLLRLRYLLPLGVLVLAGSIAVTLLVQAPLNQAVSLASTAGYILGIVLILVGGIAFIQARPLNVLLGSIERGGYVYIEELLVNKEGRAKLERLRSLVKGSTDD